MNQRFLKLNSTPDYWNQILFSELTLEEITAQSFVFFFAGFETASSTASFCLYELACNQDVQDILYKEIKETLKRNGGKTTYQALQEMVYMDQVINGLYNIFVNEYY